ncbi:MAG: hypothetical protein IKM93_06240 [Bacteroidales bacterium]|nr:hypothetical protein [Bacteroidales bacterium]
MKRLLNTALLAMVLLAGLSCKKAAPEVPAAPVAAEPRIETGDLLFFGIPMNYGEEGMSGAIAAATADGDSVNFIHTAILEVDDLGQVWVIDATIAHGVDRHPLDTLFENFVLHRGGPPTIEVMRLKDNSQAKAFVEVSKGFLGEAYDNYFLEGNGLHYCTELVYDSYVRADGTRCFDRIPMNFKNQKGEMPAYWTNIFALLGQPIPQGQPGTNPQQMHASPNLVHVTYLTNPYQH